MGGWVVTNKIPAPKVARIRQVFKENELRHDRQTPNNSETAAPTVLGTFFKYPPPPLVHARNCLWCATPLLPSTRGTCAAHHCLKTNDDAAVPRTCSRAAGREWYYGLRWQRPPPMSACGVFVVLLSNFCFIDPYQRQENCPSSFLNS